MIERIEDPGTVRRAVQLRQYVADGPVDLSSEWLKTSDSKVLAVESGRHLEDDDAAILATSYKAAGIDDLFAILNEPTAPCEEVFTINADQEDLSLISWEFSGLNFLLTDEHCTRCVVFTVDDFKLVAGPLEFVTSFAGNPRVARRDFLDFMADESDLEPVYDRALAYMDWVEVECGAELGSSPSEK